MNNLVFIGINNSKSFSGGRYHAWLMAEAAAEMGWNVSFITNDYPSFYNDFADPELYPFHSQIKVNLSKLTWGKLNSLLDTPCDLLVVIPHATVESDMYEAAITFARVKKAKIILVNFETPNWFNNLSPVKRQESKWMGWKDVARHSSMILSLAAEGSRYAREYYSDVHHHTIFEHCWPTINTRMADTIPTLGKEKRILVMTRFSHSEHKGVNLLPELLCDSMQGYNLVFVIGVGEPDHEFIKSIDDQCLKFGITLEILRCISEQEKWFELKRSSLLLFPSFFEGFGLPPVEAIYAKTPCIAFDLPVLREVNHDSIFYVPLGDTKAMRQMAGEILSGNLDYKNKINVKTPSFEDFSSRIHGLFQRALFEGPPISHILEREKELK